MAAAARISAAETASEAAAIAAEIADRRRVALFVFDPEGRLVSAGRAAGTRLDEIPDLEPALAAALGGRRFVEPSGDSSSVTVALPLRRGASVGALVAFAKRPDLEDALGIVHDEILSAALRAMLAGALIGLVVALLITRRLRRIAAAAAAIEEGRFEGSLNARFPDELGMLAKTVDQMRRRLAESFANLASERDRLQQLLEQLEEAVIAVDKGLIVVFANSRARKLVGPTARPNEPLPDLQWSNVGLRSFASTLFTRHAQSATLTVRTGADRTFLLTGLPATDDSDTAVLVLADVTARERRDRAEREFVANAAHELRTPMTAIGSAVEVLQSGAKHDPVERDRFLAVVERQAIRLTGLMQSLLTLARAQTDAQAVILEPIDLPSLMSSVARDHESQSKIVVDCPPGLKALAHSHMLHQALGNLVHNAVTHGAGGDIIVRARASGGDRVRIEVVDAGSGMSESEASNAVSRFYRGGNRRGGHGLGLSIVLELVKVMEGELLIETTPGAGTTVALDLGRANQSGQAA